MNFYTGLLFLDGHIADASLAASLSDGGEPAASDSDGSQPARGDAPIRSPRGANRRPSPNALRRHAMNLFQTLMFLGGRPMTAGHNHDSGEPFPQLYGNRVASERMFGPADARNCDSAGRTLPSQPCARC